MMTGTVCDQTLAGKATPPHRGWEGDPTSPWLEGNPTSPWLGRWPHLALAWQAALTHPASPCTLLRPGVTILPHLVVHHLLPPSWPVFAPLVPASFISSHNPNEASLLTLKITTRGASCGSCMDKNPSQFYANQNRLGWSREWHTMWEYMVQGNWERPTLVKWHISLGPCRGDQKVLSEPGYLVSCM